MPTDYLPPQFRCLLYTEEVMMGRGLARRLDASVRQQGDRKSG